MRVVSDKPGLLELLCAHRAELVDQCRERIAARVSPPLGAAELGSGVPLFLDRLIAVLSGGRAHGMARTFATARAQRALWRRDELRGGGITIEQVVHDHDELRRVITELAFRKGAPLGTAGLAVLDIGLNKAIANASREILRGRAVRRNAAGEQGRRLEAIAQEMRNSLNTATIALSAIKGGGIGVNGATGAALERSLGTVRRLVDRMLEVAGSPARAPSAAEGIDLAEFILDVQVAAERRPEPRCELTVLPVEPGVRLQADRPILGAAVTSLLDHAFERARDVVHLGACAAGGRVFIEVRYESDFDSTAYVDTRLAHCGTGVSASGGNFRLRLLPGGCRVATIDLPARRDPCAEA